MRTIFSLLTLLLIALCPLVIFAQSYRSLVNGGNELYVTKKYDDAEVEYKKSVSKDSTRLEGFFNLGNSLYRKGDQKSALEAYKKGMYKVTDTKQAAQTLHNIGNSFLDAAEKASQHPAAGQMGEEAGKLQQEGLKQEIEAYKHSLKLNAHDEDTRYNLAYAKKKLEELKQQSQQNKNDKNKNQDKNQKQNQDKQNKQDEQKKNDQKEDQKQQQQQQQEQEKGKESEAEKMRRQQEQQQQKENMMNKQQAERILDALKNDERDVQKKLKAKARVRVQVEKDW